MTVSYAPARMIARGAEVRPGDIDRLNEILHAAGLGRPIGTPATATAGAAGLTVLPVAGADPMAIRDVVRSRAGDGPGQVTLTPDYTYEVGTAEQGRWDAEFFDAAGKKSGHGAFAWLPAPGYEMPAPQPFDGPARRPVIALLDSGIQPHDWLAEAEAEAAGGMPFVVDAEDYGWLAPLLIDGPVPPYGTHWGHATFIAGLIRLLAPSARILSMKVMSSAGKVNESDVIHALSWLASPPDGAPAADVVLMAFGRQADPGDPDLVGLKDAVQALAGRTVRIVASAGNNGSEVPVYPAAFAAEPDPPVVSVGALASPTERAPYSNFGPWVREWRKGKDVISIMPLTTRAIGEQRLAGRTGFGPYTVTDSGDGYAWWSGTSFAAAICAGELAGQLAASAPLPQPGTGP
jgi:subtilisin family serine protease